MYNSDLQFESQIKNIFEQASKDSVDGYITKKKINRIQNKLDEASSKAYHNIGEKIVEVTILHLRKKLGKHSYYIKSYRNRGYCFEE